MTDDDQQRIRRYDGAQDDDQSTLPEHVMTRPDDTDDDSSTEQSTILDGLDIENRTRSLFRAAIAMFTITAATFAAYGAYFATQAAKHLYRFLKMALLTIVAVGIFKGMTFFVGFALRTVVKRAVTVAATRGSLSDRAAKTLGILLYIAGIYAVYRITMWSIQPLYDKLPYENPQATTLTDFLGDDDDDEQTDDTTQTEIPSLLTNGN